MSISLSEVSAALQVLGQPVFDTLQLVDGAALAQQYYPLLDPSSPTLVLHLDQVALDRVRDVLLQSYDPRHELTLLAEAATTLPLDRLGREGSTARTLYVPALHTPGSFSALQNVSARLRAPDGCPWDRDLTWEKLRPFLLEETYELLAALDAGDPQKVLEEQGDLLLQIALQAQIASENGQYRFPQVVGRIVDKLIRRHPHVFGEVAVSGTDEVLANWEAIKAAERAENGEKRSPLASIPPGLPALAQAESYLDRMSRLRPAHPPAEPWAALAELPPGEPVTSEMLGQVLFDLVAWAMARGVESESALRETNAIFAAEVARQNWG
jgi:tetrapyrrole methylase family protein/MazG family protein